MHNEDPLGKSAWCKLAPWGCDFFKVSILVTFQGLNSYDFLQKCQTPLAVISVLSTPTKGWSNTGCPMDVDHASLLYVLFEDQRIVFAKSFFAKDCRLTLVKSRLALGSTGCSFVRSFVTMLKMAQYTGEWLLPAP